MNNLSYVKQGNNISFPQFNGDRVYMLGFTKKDGLPERLRHWEKTVCSMLDGLDIESDNIMYLMIDERYVKAGEMHRRPGVHIDGYWLPSVNRHGSHFIGNNDDKAYSCHGHNSGSNHVVVPSGGHSTYSPSGHIHNNGGHSHVHNGGHLTNGSKIKKRMGSKEYVEWEPEALILASNVSASRAWNGIYEGSPSIGGDCSHIDLSELEEIKLLRNKTYLGNVTMLHESLPIEQDCHRSLVRINVPGLNLN